MKKIKIIFFGFLILFLPLTAFAQNLGQKYEQLLNPLPENELICLTRTCDLLSLFLLIIRDILQIIPIVSVIFIIIGGFKMISSSGNEQKLAEAKRTVVWAVLGLVVAVLSFSIIAIVQNLIGASF